MPARDAGDLAGPADLRPGDAVVVGPGDVRVVHSATPLPDGEWSIGWLDCRWSMVPGSRRYPRVHRAVPEHVRRRLGWDPPTPTPVPELGGSDDRPTDRSD